ASVIAVDKEGGITALWQRDHREWCATEIQGGVLVADNDDARTARCIRKDRGLVSARCEHGGDPAWQLIVRRVCRRIDNCDDVLRDQKRTLSLTIDHDLPRRDGNCLGAFELLARAVKHSHRT